jgi:hypothetical protein
VAADAVGCALMGIDPMEVRMIKLGAAAGLGEADLTRIDIIGEELKLLQFKVKLPREQIKEAFPDLEIIGAEKACSGCLIPLVSALTLLEERGVEMKRPLTVCLGKNPRVPAHGAYLLIGDCAGAAEDDGIPGCPPDREAIIDSLARAMTTY